MRVRDMEFQIPIPDQDESFLKSFFRTLTRKYRDEYTPMRLTLELRIMGGSDRIMAPQAGNNHTASIEVLTVPDAQQDGEWVAFMQVVSDKWMNYKDNSKTPMRLNTRPHWAKEWETLKMGPRNLDARQYLRTESYRDPIVNFKQTLERIGMEQGWKMEDIRARFSNELWDAIVYS
ncbi:MAG: hypothetical protein Q9161_005750 [Pseudevernia consocians]